MINNAFLIRTHTVIWYTW